MADFKNGVIYKTLIERKAASFPVFCMLGTDSNKNVNKYASQSCLNILIVLHITLAKQEQLLVLGPSQVPINILNDKLSARVKPALTLCSVI